MSISLKRVLIATLIMGMFAYVQVSATEQIHLELLNDYKPKQLTPHVWMIEGPRSYPTPENQGFMNNPGFIITDKSVAVVDPGSSAPIGRALLAHIKSQTDKPVTHVFTSHVHGDHWLANHAIKETFPDAVFYAHPNMIKLASEGAADNWLNTMETLTEGATQGTKAVIPTEALTNGQLIKIDGVTVKAHLAQEKAHTTTDVMYEVLNDKVLFTGDNINYHRIVRMDDGSFVGNIEAARYALALDIETIVPGHGPSGGKQILQLNHDYLSTIHNSVKELREDDMETFEMKPEISRRLEAYKEWSGFNDELGKHISLSGLESEAEDF